MAGREIAKALRQLARITERVEPTHTLDLIPADPSDNRILECADAGEAHFVVSGDNHLLRLKQHGGAPIVRVGDFLRQLQGQAGQQRS